MKSPSVLQGEKGSITVLIAFLLPVMILMLALIVNINQLVFTKIRLQTTVDACALSAAAVQAAGLNEIADLNKEMVAEYNNIKRILRRGIWKKSEEAEDAKNYFFNGNDGVIDEIRRHQNDANSNYSDYAWKVAQTVQELNFLNSKLTPGPMWSNPNRLTELKEFKHDIEYKYYNSDSSKSSVETRSWTDPPGDVRKYTGNHDGSKTDLAKRTDRREDTFSILQRVKKREDYPTYVDYQLTMDQVGFILADSIFRQRFQLSARAMARPAGGNVYRGVPKYKAVLVK